MDTVKKWLRRLAVGTVALVAGLVIVFLLGSVVARQISEHRAERDFPPPGRLVEIEGRSSHIHCTGSGSPMILLESGLDDRGSWSWAFIQEEISTISRVCSYDRAGMIWSEPREGPRDAERISRELHSILAAASEKPPYVMVGHSFGGLMIRVYDHLYPGEVAGFVFVDSSHPEQERRFPPEIQERMKKGQAESKPRWLFRILAPYRIITGERQTPRTAYWWRTFPEGVLAESAAVDATFEQAARTSSLGDRPVVVLTSGVPFAMPHISPQGNRAMEKVMREMHGELAQLSTDSDHRIVEGARHYIHRDRPEAVIAAIRDVVTAVRERG